MTEVDEKARRLAEWHELLSGTVSSGNFDAWYHMLRHEIDHMKSAGLIDSDEKREMCELADAAFSYQLEEAINERIKSSGGCAMSEPSNPYALWPRHHQLFILLRDGGDTPANLAPNVAAIHGISVDELKAHCRQAGDEWIARDRGLNEISQRVYDWAKG